MKPSDTQEKIAIAVTGFLGFMGVTALLGIIFRAGKVPETTMAVLASVVTGSMAGLPSLLAKLTSAATDKASDKPTDVTVVNKDKDPIPVEVKDA